MIKAERPGKRWVVAIVATMVLGGTTPLRAQSLQEYFNQAIETLREAGAQPERPATPPQSVPLSPDAEPPLPAPRPEDREELAATDAPVDPAGDLPPAEQDQLTENIDAEDADTGGEEPEVADDIVTIEVDDGLPPPPRSRPDEIVAPEPEVVPDVNAASDDMDHEPAPEPGRVYQAACPAVISGLVEAEVVAPVHENQCGLQSPLNVTAVMIAGKRVPLTQPATLNCAMAGELARWAARFDNYSEAIFNAGVETILTGTSYYCRPRNNVEGADISEHGFGNALDVTGFTLENGDRISLPDDWGDGEEAEAMELAHDTACGFFTTVLGPDANALHRDHLHLDLGCHGRTCTARLCE